MPDHDQPADDFSTQFLDDYFAECEEHLAIIRRDLLNIEQFVARPGIDHGQLDELFRSFHTIKGISGMVGLTPAEELAHEMESYLRVLRQGTSSLSKDGFEALLAGAKVLTDVIEAHRTHSTQPDTSHAITALIEATATPQIEADSPPNAETPGAQPRKEEWRFIFAPSPERSEAGLNVNSVRNRLQAFGEIVRAVPLVDKGEVAFEFVVSTNNPESDFAELRDLGLTVTKIEDEPILTQTATSATQTQGTSVRVDLVRLDQLMLLVGELVVTRARLEQNLNAIRTSVTPTDWRHLHETNITLGKQLRDLRNDVMRVRMVPIAEVFDRMRFVVRDIARETQKRVSLEISGQETEIDKFLVERLMDPLLHLVRNSISHGIETEAERFTAGKPAEGRIFINAKTAGELVIIEVGDDGRGLDIGAIENNSGVRVTDDYGKVDFPLLLDIITKPGFSTRSHVDRASGRGVGMDVVAKTISDLDGELSVHSEKGSGTTFKMELPLTLAITDALIATVAGHTFAVHRSSVREVIEISTSSLKVMENNELIVHRDQLLPLVRLSRIFNLKGKHEGTLHALVIGTGDRATGIVVDKVLGLREVVVRSLNDPLTDVQGFAGATELGDGRPVLILDVMEILEAARRSYTLN